jgi:anaerobic nitric oxide reductase flavorubredoxin
MNAVAEGVARTGLPLQIFDCARTHDSYVLPYAWLYSGILIGAPTYEVSLYPPMVGTLHTLAEKRVMNKKAAYFGSFGWSGGAKRETMALTEKLNWTWVDTLEVQGAPTHDDLRRAQDFGEAFARGLLQA